MNFISPFRFDLRHHRRRLTVILPELDHPEAMIVFRQLSRLHERAVPAPILHELDKGDRRFPPRYRGER